MTHPGSLEFQEININKSGRITCTIVAHISLAVSQLSPESPKHGNTVTFTF